MAQLDLFGLRPLASFESIRSSLATFAKNRRNGHDSNIPGMSAKADGLGFRNNNKNGDNLTDDFQILAWTAGGRFNGREFVVIAAQSKGEPTQTNTRAQSQSHPNNNKSHHSKDHQFIDEFDFNSYYHHRSDGNSFTNNTQYIPNCAYNRPSEESQQYLIIRAINALPQKLRSKSRKKSKRKHAKLLKESNIQHLYGDTYHIDGWLDDDNSDNDRNKNKNEKGKNSNDNRNNNNSKQNGSKKARIVINGPNGSGEHKHTHTHTDDDEDDSDDSDEFDIHSISSLDSSVGNSPLPHGGLETGNFSKFRQNKRMANNQNRDAQLNNSNLSDNARGGGGDGAGGSGGGLNNNDNNEECDELPVLRIIEWFVTLMASFDKTIIALDFNPSGSWLSVICRDCSVYLLPLRSLFEIPTHQLELSVTTAYEFAHGNTNEGSINDSDFFIKDFGKVTKGDLRRGGIISENRKKSKKSKKDKHKKKHSMRLGVDQNGNDENDANNKKAMDKQRETVMKIGSASLAHLVLHRGKPTKQRR